MLRMVFLVAWLLVAGAAAGQVPAVGGVLPPGSAFELRSADGSRDREVWCDRGSGSCLGAEVRIVTCEAFGSRTSSSEYWFSRAGDGDILLHGMILGLNRRTIYFDPPLTVVDLPLHEGKTWTVDSRCFDSSGKAADYPRYRQEFRVGAPASVETPLGRRQAYTLEGTAIAGPPPEDLVYAPDLGIIARRLAPRSPWRRLVDASSDGKAGLAWCGQPVRLDFAWPEGQAYRFEINQVAYPGQPDVAPDSSLTVFDWTYRKTSFAGRIGQRTVVRGPTTAAISAFTLPASAYSFRIHRDGTFAGLDHVQAMCDSARADVMRSFPDDATVAKEARETTLRVMTSRHCVNQLARLAWDLMVGGWLSCEGNTGVVHDLSGLASFSDVAGVGLKVHAMASVDGACPCEENGATDDCLRLTMSTLFDSRALMAVASRLMARAGKTGYSLPDDEVFASSLSMTAVVEPGTMIVHRYDGYSTTTIMRRVDGKTEFEVLGIAEMNGHVRPVDSD